MMKKAKKTAKARVTESWKKYIKVVEQAKSEKATVNKKVPDRLADLGNIYRERNAVYGDTYRLFGRVMKGFFPNDVTLRTAEDWNRMALFFHCADKLARYAGSFARGGHVDSLDDNAVYSVMLQEFDQDVRNKSRSDKEGA